MLFLLFKIRSDRYALANNHIVKVIPNLHTKKVPSSPDYFSGLVNYQGDLIPVIDVNTLITGEPCEDLMSTRIILIKSPHKGENNIMGLQAEYVLETIKTADDWQLDVDTEGSKNTFYIDSSITKKRVLIQLFEPEKVLPENIAKILK